MRLCVICVCFVSSTNDFRSRPMLAKLIMRCHFLTPLLFSLSRLVVVVVVSLENWAIHQKRHRHTYCMQQQIGTRTQHGQLSGSHALRFGRADNCRGRR